jgi:hypothetical protein
MMEHTQEQIDAILELAHGTYSMRDELANKYLTVEQQRDKLLEFVKKTHQYLRNGMFYTAGIAEKTHPIWVEADELIAALEATKHTPDCRLKSLIDGGK